MDWIWLKGVRCRAQIGVPDWERRRRQALVFDVGIELDLSAAGASDSVERTVDYWALEKAVRETVEGRPRRLLESAASDVAKVALERAPGAAAVRVIARKRPSVMPKTKEVQVEIERRRAGAAL